MAGFGFGRWLVHDFFGWALGCLLFRDCYGGHSVGETPGPIPNPEAKAHCADGTALVRVWESRSPPDLTWSKRRHLLMLLWLV